jgi:hypothetical protein
MVRYLPAPRLRQAGLTTNGKSNTYGLHNPFALRYRRVNETFYEAVKELDDGKKLSRNLRLDNPILFIDIFFLTP